MPRPQPVVFGLYPWAPAYGFHYVHPANRRSFEYLEPVGKLFEKIKEADEGEWIIIRYDEQQFLVRPELFRELSHGQRPAFSFGDVVVEARPAAGHKPHRGLISDVFWLESEEQARFQLVENKRKVSRVFEAEELRAG